MTEPTPKITRLPIEPRLLEEAFKRARAEMERRLNKHGSGIFASNHEILGALVEEMGELEDAVRSNEVREVMYELLDVAVAALCGFASVSQLHDGYLPSQPTLKEFYGDER